MAEIFSYDTAHLALDVFPAAFAGRRLSVVRRDERPPRATTQIPSEL
jgi:hypothetical protein